MPNPVIFGVTTNSISWYIANLSSAWDDDNYDNAYLTFSGGVSPSGTLYPPTSGTNTFTPTSTKSGFAPGTTYTAYGWATAANGITYPAGEATFTTVAVRPGYFFWQYSSISSGSTAIVDYRDWNNLAANINALRIYKGLGTYGFTTVGPGNIAYWHFNQMINGSAALAPYMSNYQLPSTVNSLDTAYASYFTRIVTSINSVN